MKIFFGNFRKDLEFFPYRKAIVKGGVVITPESEDYQKALRNVCRLARVNPDNHICFRNSEVAIMFSDGQISISSPDALVVGNW